MSADALPPGPACDHCRSPYTSQSEGKGWYCHSCHRPFTWDPFALPSPEELVRIEAAVDRARHRKAMGLPPIRETRPALETEEEG